jgi:potassium-transporting ATPase KdpC subunit
MKTALISLKIFLVLTILTGVIYPLLIMGIAQVFFHDKANGSMITRNGVTIGSRLIGQQFDTAIYFSSRPSAISYNPLPSSGSNFGLFNSKLKDAVVERSAWFLKTNRLSEPTPVPSEMLFASGSGLDPHISPQSAFLQVNRVALARNLNIQQKHELLKTIDEISEGPQLFILGEDRINVLLLNLKLDEISQNH